jgi:hypothetical protein
MSSPQTVPSSIANTMCKLQERGKNILNNYSYGVFTVCYYYSRILYLETPCVQIWLTKVIRKKILLVLLSNNNQFSIITRYIVSGFVDSVCYVVIQLSLQYVQQPGSGPAPTQNRLRSSIDDNVIFFCTDLIEINKKTN